LKIKRFIQEQEDYTIISKETPLISNLNILENISLIKEVHEFMPTTAAENIAKQHLKKAALLDIAYKRPINCTNSELLSVMLLRAMMCKSHTIIISNPIDLLNNLKDIKDIIRDIKDMPDEKNIIILDLLSNEIHYEGCSCHTIR